MSKKKAGPGRPCLPHAKDMQLNLRIDRQIERAAKAYARKHKIRGVGSAVRDAAAKTFRAEGLLS